MNSSKNRIKTAIVIVVLFVRGTLLNIPFNGELKRLKIDADNTHVKLSDSIAIEIVQTGIYVLILGVMIVFLGF